MTHKTIEFPPSISFGSFIVNNKKQFDVIDAGHVIEIRFLLEIDFAH